MRINRPYARDFPTDQELSDSNEVNFKIIVPSTRGANQPISEAAFRKRIEATIQFLTETFGGSTYDFQTGTYTSISGEVIEERVALVEVFATTADWNLHDVDVYDWLVERRKNWGQEAMGFEFEGDFLFV